MGPLASLGLLKFLVDNLSLALVVKLALILVIQVAQHFVAHLQLMVLGQSLIQVLKFLADIFAEDILQVLHKLAEKEGVNNYHLGQLDCMVLDRLLVHYAQKDMENFLQNEYLAEMVTLENMVLKLAC